MKKKPTKFDFWYAVSNTEIVSMPTRTIETFGATLLNYHMISELMDSVDKVRVREGRIQAYRPQILTPDSYEQDMLEGFGEEAEKYVDWMNQNRVDMRVLQYGFKIRKEQFSEEIISDSLTAVTERVKEDINDRDDQFSAVVVGVDEPWEVCLVKLMIEVVKTSIPSNIADMEKKNLFGSTDGVPNVLHKEIEAAFSATAKNPALVGKLAAKLEHHGLFNQYEDRFFTLVRSRD